MAPRIAARVASVLVVDDDGATRDALRLLFEDAGYTVLEAPGGAAALAVLRVSPQPLVALLDLVMPDPDGGTVLRTVEAEPELRRHGYVVVTAEAASRFSPELHDLLAAVCLGVVAKPFDVDHLLEVVHRADSQVAGHLVVHQPGSTPRAHHDVS